jgi:hypothetical protein
MGLGSSRPVNRHERAFRRLVRLYPAGFRAKYGDQMAGLFADQLRDSRTSGNPLAVAQLWAHVVIDLVATAPQQHLRKDSPVLQPVEPTNVPAPAARSPLLRAVEVVASVPVIVWAAVWVVAPRFMDPVFLNPPAMLGLPAGVFPVAFAGGMAVFGWLVARRARTLGVALGALVFLTIPGLLLLLLAPALILVVFNLAGTT